MLVDGPKIQRWNGLKALKGAEGGGELTAGETLWGRLGGLLEASAWRNSWKISGQVSRQLGNCKGGC